MRRLAVCFAVLFALSIPAAAQAAYCPTVDSTGHCIRFLFERPGAPTPKYVIVVREDRTIKYWEGDPPFEELAKLKHLPIHAETMDAIFAARDVIETGACETKLKHIANTGKKTMRVYDGDVMSRDCIFNYADDERLNVAMQKCEAMAETMQMGTRLEHTHRFDRLGLDALIDSYAEEIKDGRAIEAQLIHSTLESIRDDERVMERVRRKAAHLLENSSLK